MVTPWPPQRNGIADYAYALADATDESLLIVTDAARPAVARDDHVVIGQREFLDLPQAHRPPCVYHVGNNPDHAFVVALFLRCPGSVVLHDLSLHYLAHQVERFWPGFVAAQMRAEPPEIAARYAAIAPAGLSRDIDQREIRLLGWLRAAPGVIVHSEAARRVVQPALPAVPVHVVPHFCYRPGPGVAVLEAWRDRVRDPVRARFMADVAFSGPAFVLTSLGFPSADKQLHAVLRAIARLPDSARSQVVLLVAGQTRPGDPDVLAQAAGLGIADRVRLLGWVAPDDADRLLLAADLVLALRFPTRGESSGAVARALGLGCAVVVSDHGSYAELPDHSVIKLPARADPSEALRGLFAALIDDRSRIVRTRNNAARHAQTDGDPAAIAARHVELARGQG